MRPEFWKEQFSIRAETPALWALQARRLKQAADILFQTYAADLREMERGVSPLELENLEMVGVASLLYGLCFENILKALILEAEESTVKNGRVAVMEAFTAGSWTGQQSVRGETLNV